MILVPYVLLKALSIISCGSFYDQGIKNLNRGFFFFFALEQDSALMHEFISAHYCCGH